MKAMSALPDEPGGTPPSMPTRIGQFAASVGAAMMIAGFGLVLIILIFLASPLDKSGDTTWFFISGLLAGGLVTVGVPLLVVGLVVRSVGSAYSATTHADQQPPPPGGPPSGAPPTSPGSDSQRPFEPGGPDSPPPLPPRPPPSPFWDPPQRPIE